MFSNALKKKIIAKFNLSKDVINSTKHYKIPTMIFRPKNGINNQCRYHYPTDEIFNFQVQFQPDLLLDNISLKKRINKTQYFQNKMKSTNNLISKIQRNKINLLIQRSYNKLNNNIRKYNQSISLPKTENNLKIKPLPLITRNKIIEHILGQYKIYMDKNKDIDKRYDLINEKMRKQYIWSHNILEEKKIKEYKKIYRIKYLTLNQIDTKKEEKIPIINRFKNEPFYGDKRYKTCSIFQ